MYPALHPEPHETLTPLRTICYRARVPPRPETHDILRLTLIPGLGPVRIARLLAAFETPQAVLGASSAQLERVKGIGSQLARAILAGAKDSQAALEKELALAESLGVTLLARGTPDYPALLNQFPDSPPILYVRGRIEPATRDVYPVGIVGSRQCTTYGMEQAERFGSILAQSGLTIVSGGARGIDTAAHRGALRAGGRTIAVLGCGLAHCYPPENKELFDKIAAGHGAVVSELPLSTPPTADNFPARNRIISALSLGIVVIEAGVGSGALITARQATEEHGREVMALPGRVDSEASRGSNQLLRDGGAALVLEPGDVIHQLESPARHTFGGTHADRYAPAPSADPLFDVPALEVGEPQRSAKSAPAAAEGAAGADPILAALAEPCTMDELSRLTGLEPGMLRSRLTLLEIQRRVVREGAVLRLRGR